MNKPPTFEPLGRIARNSSGRRRFPIAVVAFVLLHGVFFSGMLLQGCRPKTPEGDRAQAPTNGLPNVEDLWNRLSPPAPTNRVRPPTNRVQPPPAPPSTSNTPPVIPVPVDRDLAALGQTNRPPSQEIVTNPPPVRVEPPPGITPRQSEDLARAREHVIKSNDTLWGIGQEYGVSVAELERANPNVVPTKLSVGSTLIIPPKREAPAAPAPEPYAGTLHEIVKNDTLNGISRKYGVTVEAIMKENDMKTTRIYAGRTLQIPTHRRN